MTALQNISVEDGDDYWYWSYDNSDNDEIMPVPDIFYTENISQCSFEKTGEPNSANGIVGLYSVHYNSEGNAIKGFCNWYKKCYNSKPDVSWEKNYDYDNYVILKENMYTDRSSPLFKPEGQRTENPRVGGSIPPLATTKKIKKSL
jgi:hypothetical protein